MHAQAIEAMLREIYGSTNYLCAYGLIDLMLVILEGGTRDMGTTFHLLNDVILPYMQRDRVLAAFIQMDIEMKGHCWVSDKHQLDNFSFEAYTSSYQNKLI